MNSHKYCTLLFASLLLLLLPHNSNGDSLRVSGKEFAGSFLEVLNDMRTNPLEYTAYVEEHFKILKKNVFTHNQSDSPDDLDNNEVLLKVEADIRNLIKFLQGVKSLSPLNRNKGLTHAAQKIVKSNARHNQLKYRVSSREKEVKDLDGSKIILEREKVESAKDLLNKAKVEAVSEIYQMTGKFHLSFRNMLNCLLMFLSTGYTQNDLVSKRNLMFFSHEQFARKREREEKELGRKEEGRFL